ncbi:hypothetical protein QEH56_14790 [Pelagicoccus enzymogenes]|uniref:hypothetical protein n=1 Tax=Pelagicoccus enzymogenes TaxID=2773457 RepID=UPI00280E82CE|nr:hypothetical protein [Pelagicoccus enzymogenes]MDQ8199431.1 hypothetical protein [Pelagicoccus enzymogenes]
MKLSLSLPAFRDKRAPNQSKKTNIPTTVAMSKRFTLHVADVQPRETNRYLGSP